MDSNHGVADSTRRTFVADQPWLLPGAEIDTSTKTIRADRPAPNYQHARDIPDEDFLRAIETATGVWARQWAMRDDVARVLAGLPIGRDTEWIPEIPGVPSKVVLAKFRRVKSRGLADGCDCGCRGDFELTEAGRIFLGLPRPR